MPQSYSSVQVHLVFSTKDRHPFLGDPAIRAEMHRYLGGISKAMDCPPVVVGGVADHVHVLAGLGRSVSQSEWVKEVKRKSSMWVKEREPSLAGFAWQGGYGAFSVERSTVDKVRRYIENQEQHHQKHTFQDEFRAILKQHGISWDEKYIWL